MAVWKQWFLLVKRKITSDI